MDDPSMGWARYAHSMRVFCFNSGLFYIRPTEAAQHLLEVIMKRIETEAGWDQAIFNEVVFSVAKQAQGIKDSIAPGGPGFGLGLVSNLAAPASFAGGGRTPLKWKGGLLPVQKTAHSQMCLPPCILTFT